MRAKRARKTEQEPGHQQTNWHCLVLYNLLHRWTCSIYLWPKRFLHWAGWSCPGVPIPPKESTNARGANKILKELIGTMRGWQEPKREFAYLDSRLWISPNRFLHCKALWAGGPWPGAPIPPKSISAWGANKILKELIRTMRGWKEGLHIWTPDSGYHQTDSFIAKQVGPSLGPGCLSVDYLLTSL